MTPEETLESSILDYVNHTETLAALIARGEPIAGMRDLLEHARDRATDPIIRGDGGGVELNADTLNPWGALELDLLTHFNAIDSHTLVKLMADDRSGQADDEDSEEINVYGVIGYYSQDLIDFHAREIYRITLAMRALLAQTRSPTVEQIQAIRNDQEHFDHGLAVQQ